MAEIRWEFISFVVSAQAAQSWQRQLRDPRPFLLWLLLSRRYCTFQHGQRGVTPHPCSCLQEGRKRERGGQAILFLKTPFHHCCPKPSHVHTQLQGKLRNVVPSQLAMHPSKLLICGGQGSLVTQRKKGRMESGRHLAVLHSSA